MKRYFADTFFFVAYLSPRDRHHKQAREFFAALDGILVTTEWILTELADGFSKPASRPRVATFIETVSKSSDVEVVSSNGELFEAGCALFRERPDKHWTLTDCISFVVMSRRNLFDALTADRHFQQAGFRALFRNEA